MHIKILLCIVMFKHSCLSIFWVQVDMYKDTFVIGLDILLKMYIKKSYN